MSPESIISALSLVKHGTIFDLGLEFGGKLYATLPDYSTPFHSTRSLSGSVESGVQICSEVIGGSIHHGTHIDALIHFQKDGHVFGGKATQDATENNLWTAFGAETIPPIVCRGVLLDLAKARGSALPDGFVASRADVQSAAIAQNIEFSTDSAVLIRTGKTGRFTANTGEDWSSAPGISAEAAFWLAEQGMMLLGIDSPSPDAMPFKDWSCLAHIELLTERGIHIVENLNLEELSLADSKEFAVVCTPLKFHGMSGGWVRPIAII